MDHEIPVRVKQELCEGEVEEGETRGDIDVAEELEATKVDIDVKLKFEEIKKEELSYDASAEIVEDEREIEERATNSGELQPKERRLNNSEKKYECETCGKRFSTPSDLK